MEIRRTSRIGDLALFGFIFLSQLRGISSQPQTAPPFLPFRFVSEPTDVVVRSGTRVTLDCSIETDFRPTFVWYRDDTRIRPDARYSLALDGTLTIHPVTDSNTGSYRCRVFDSGNTLFTVDSREATVSIATLYLDQSYPVDVTDIYQGDTARYECRVEGSGPFTYAWLRNRQQLDLSEERIAARYSLLPSGTLEIVGLRSSDEGAYSCRATSTYGLQALSQSAQLGLRGGIPSSSRVFEFTQQLEGNMEYKVGTPVVLEVATTQPADFRWFKDNEEISLSGNHYSYVGQGSLYIQELAEIDTAIYRVEATSRADSTTIQSSAHILALVPPTYIRPPSNKYAQEGEIAILPCKTYGIRPPTVVWMRDGDPITIGRDFQLVQGQSLSISSALQSDSGFYQCVASNEVGNVQSSMQLIVLGQGVPIPIIRTTAPSTTMTPSTTVRTNSPTPLPVIIEFPVDSPDGPVPSQPRRAAVSRTTSRTTYLTWQPPANPNGEIRKYRIQLKAEGSGIRDRIIFVSGDTAKIIRDLLPDTLYNVQILAINENGPGEMTDPISFRTREAVNVPEEPESIEAMVQSSHSVLVTWEAPIDTFGELEGYRLYYAIQNGLASRELEVPVRGTSYVVEGLDSYTAYGFRVLAINANGAGESTDVRQVRTFSARPGRPPANFTSVSTTASSITLNWDPPGSDRNGVISEYRIRYRIIGSKESKTEISVSGSLDSYTMAELERATGYEFKIAAVTVNGTGPYTELWLQETTREREFGVICNLMKTVRAIPDACSLTTSHTPGGRGSDAPIRYLTEWPMSTWLGRSSGDGAPHSTAHRRSSLSVGIIRPRRRDGNVLSKTRSPSQPAALHVEGFSDHIVVQWAPPRDPYLRVRGYLLDYGKGIPDQNSENLGPSVRSFTIEDVEVNALYVIRLRAFNLAGEGDDRLETVFTRRVTEATALAVPFPVEALTQSDTSIRLQWTDPNPRRDGTVYIVSYNLEDMSTVYKQLNTTNQYYVFSDLEPFSSYVFIVRISQGSLMSDLSMEARNTTFEAVPATPPTGLVVIGYENSSSLLLNWNRPSRPNGIITGYVLYYTNEDKTTSISEWETVSLVGNKTAFTLVDLDENSDYHVRVQAVNGAGLSPISAIATGTTGAAYLPPLPYDGAIPGTAGAGTGALAGFPWWMWLIALALLVLLLLLLLLLLLCALCGCFKCCASLCPCCGDVCGAGGCFGQCWAGLTRCFVGCFPCCCSDEEECAGFCSKLCCGACICGGAGAKSGSSMNGAATAISAGSYKSNGPDVLLSSSVEETDALMHNAHGEATTEFGGSRKVEAMQPFATMTRFSHPSGVPYMYPANGGMTINRHMNGSVYETDDGRMRVNGQYWIRDDSRQHGQQYLHTADSASYDHSVASFKAASRTYSEIPNGKREPIIKKSTGYFEGDRGFEREHHAGSAEGMGQNVTYNTTNVHVAGEHDGSHSDMGRRGAVTPVTSVSTQMVNYPASIEGAADPFTITFEETTTTHSIEKSVPLLDGTNYKTISNHETHAKSYSTSDASKDRNLQMMLQNGLDSGPLAIDVPSTRMEPLSAITAPVYTRGTLDRGTSSLDSYSSSSHNQASSDTNLQAASRATTNLHNYEREGTSSSRNLNSDLNMQSSHATTNLNSYQGGVADLGQAYRVELPATLPRHGSNLHTSFEEHSESRVQDYGTGSSTGRVDIASRHLAETDGEIIRQEESKESFPYTMSDMIRDDLTMSQLGGASSSLTHHETGLGSLRGMEYLPVDDRAQSSGQFQSSSDHASSDHTSRHHQSRRMDTTSSDKHYGTDTHQSHRSMMSDSQYGTGGSDMVNSGSAYRYKSTASLDGNMANMAPSGGRGSNFQTIDRSEGLDRLENLRRLTNKVLSSSQTRLATQNGAEPIMKKSTGYFEGDRGFEREEPITKATGYFEGDRGIEREQPITKSTGYFEGDRGIEREQPITKSTGYFEGDRGIEREQPITKSTGYFEGDRGIERERMHAYSTDHLDRAGGHNEGFESGFTQRQVYRARSGSSGYQSTGNLAGGSYQSMGNLASGGGGGQYSFNNNNSKSNLTEHEPTGIEDSSDWSSRLQKPRSHYQSPDGMVKVSPSPNAHRYLPPPPDSFGKGQLERSQSIADQIGRDRAMRVRSSGRNDPPSSAESDTQRKLMRSFSLDRLNTGRKDPMTNHPPPMYQYHSTGSSENPRYIYSSGYHSDTTLSSGGHEDPHSGGPSRSGVNPNLSSFNVPGPPPHYQTGPSRVRISAPTYSPLKRTNQPTATVQVRAQPLGGPRDGRFSPGSATRTFSTEDLNAEMQHLEGLMKDLNAITASELEESSN